MQIVRAGDITGFDDADILILEDPDPFEEESIAEETETDND